MKSLKNYIIESSSNVVKINNLINNIMDELWDNYLQDSPSKETDEQHKIIEASDSIIKLIHDPSDNTELTDEGRIKEAVNEFVSLIEDNALKYLSDNAQESLKELKEIFGIY